MLSIVLKDVVLVAYRLQIDLEIKHFPVGVKTMRVYDFLNYFTGCVLGGAMQTYLEVQIGAHAKCILS